MTRNCSSSSNNNLDLDLGHDCDDNDVKASSDNEEDLQQQTPSFVPFSRRLPSSKKKKKEKKKEFTYLDEMKLAKMVRSKTNNCQGQFRRAGKDILSESLHPSKLSKDRKLGHDLSRSLHPSRFAKDKSSCHDQLSRSLHPSKFAKEKSSCHDQLSRSLHPSRFAKDKNHCRDQLSRSLHKNTLINKSTPLELNFKDEDDDIKGEQEESTMGMIRRTLSKENLMAIASSVKRTLSKDNLLSIAGSPEQSASLLSEQPSSNTDIDDRPFPVRMNDHVDDDRKKSSSHSCRRNSWQMMNQRTRDDNDDVNRDDKNDGDKEEGYTDRYEPEVRDGEKDDKTETNDGDLTGVDLEMGVKSMSKSMPALFVKKHHHGVDDADTQPQGPRRHSCTTLSNAAAFKSMSKSVSKLLVGNEDKEQQRRASGRRMSLSDANALHMLSAYISDDDDGDIESNSEGSSEDLDFDFDNPPPFFFNHVDGDSVASSRSRVNGIPLYSKPVQRQLWGDPHLVVHVGWNTLFFDLFYVAAAYNLGNLLLSIMSSGQEWGRGLIFMFGIFSGIYNIFVRMMLYESQFTVNDYAHRLLEVIRVFLLSVVVLHIKSIDLLLDPTTAESFALTTALFLETLVHVVLTLELYFGCDDVGDSIAIQNQMKRQLMTNYLPVATFYFIGSVLSGYLYYNSDDGGDNSGDGGGGATMSNIHSQYEDGYGHRFLGGEGSGGGISTPEDNDWTVGDIPIGLCFVAALYSIIRQGLTVIMTLRPQNPEIRSSMVPINIDYLIHRFGEFTLLFFGEAVMCLLIVDTTDAASAYYYVAMLGCLNVVVLQALKYESEPHPNGHADDEIDDEYDDDSDDSDADEHCLWKGMKYFFIYSLLTQLLCFSLIAFGISFKAGLKFLVSSSPSNNDDYNSGEYHNISDSSESYGVDDSYSAHRELGGDSKFTVSKDVIAKLFCASLTVILTTIEIMSYSHRGLKKTYTLFFRSDEEDHRRATTVVNWKVLFGTMFKLTLLLTVATLYLSITKLNVLVGIGFLVSIIFAASKVMEIHIINDENRKAKLKKIVVSIRASIHYSMPKKPSLGASFHNSMLKRPSICFSLHNSMLHKSTHGRSETLPTKNEDKKHLCRSITSETEKDRELFFN